MLADINGFPPGQWVLEPGMGFGDRIKWWGDRGPRAAAHNGLDLKFYREAGDNVRFMDGRSLVPVMAEGEVINIVSDFLGRSVFIAHGDDNGLTLVSAFGHLIPNDEIVPGAHLKRGDIIGKLSEYDGMPVPPHLHYSLIESGSADIRGIDWPTLETSGSTRFLDPLVN